MERAGLADRPTVEAVDRIHLTQLAVGDRTSIQGFEIEAGATVPEHSHRHEQTGFVHEGELTFLVDGETIPVGAGTSSPSRAGSPTPPRTGATARSAAWTCSRRRGPTPTGRSEDGPAGVPRRRRRGREPARWLFRGRRRRRDIPTVTPVPLPGQGGGGSGPPASEDGVNPPAVGDAHVDELRTGNARIAVEYAAADGTEAVELVRIVSTVDGPEPTRRRYVLRPLDLGAGAYQGSARVGGPRAGAGCEGHRGEGRRPAHGRYRLSVTDRGSTNVEHPTPARTVDWFEELQAASPVRVSVGKSVGKGDSPNRAGPDGPGNSNGEKGVAAVRPTR